MSLSAPIVQPGGKPAASRKARLRGTIRFKPRVKRRPVVVQRRLGTSGSWKTIAKRRQNGAGIVAFHGPAVNRNGTAFSYRGIAKKWGGNRRVVSNVRSADLWEDAFRDEFAKRRRLGPKWEDRPVESSSRQCSKVGDPRTSHVRRGTLRLQVKLDPDRRNRRCRVDGHRFRYYLNGQVSTQHLGEMGGFTYGTFAARMKFPRKRGQHGAFWMQPLGGGADRGTAAASGAEIDIAEFFGQGYPGGGFASFLYNYGVLDKSGNPVKIGGVWPKATRMLPKRDRWWTRYHVFSLEWTKRYYKFMVDGRTHFKTKRGVSGIDEYLILSLLTSDWELRQAKKHGVKPGGTMHVDWVRAWQR